MISYPKLTKFFRTSLILLSPFGGVWINHKYGNLDDYKTTWNSVLRLVDIILILVSILFVIGLLNSVGNYLLEREGSTVWSIFISYLYLYTHYLGRVILMLFIEIPDE